jgi:hypothetical protein
MHVPEKPASDEIGGGNRISDKDLRKRENESAAAQKETGGSSLRKPPPADKRAR